MSPPTITETRPHYALWPVAYAAQIAGLSVKLFVSAVDRGQMGRVEILVLGGQQERYIRAASLVDFLEDKPELQAFRAIEIFRARQAADRTAVHPTAPVALDEPADLFA